MGCGGSTQVEAWSHQEIEPTSLDQVDPKVAEALVDLLIDHGELPPEQQIVSIEDVEKRDLTGLVEITHPDFAPYDPEPSANAPGKLDKMKAARHMQKLLQSISSPKPAAEKLLVWSRENPGTPTYEPPVGNREEEVMGVPMDVSDSPRRQVIALSDCHLVGAGSSQVNITRLLQTMETFARDETIHTLVLLGDLLEMWIQPYDEDRLTDQQLVEGWKSDDPCQKFLQSLMLLVKNGVCVYYVMGNHDHKFTPWMVEELGFTLGGKFQLVRGILVLEVKVDDRLYRVRFEHGHNEDIFCSYGGCAEEDLIGGEPLGYVCSRTSGKRDGGLLKTYQATYVGALLSAVGPQLLHLLSSRERSEKYLRILLEIHLGKKLTDDDVVFYQGNKFLNLRKYSRFQLFKRSVDRHGLEKAFSMYKAAYHDYADFLRTCGEDVVVLGHTHQWTTGRFAGKGNRDVLYANTGAWCTRVEEPTYVRIVPPTTGEDGSIEVIIVTD